MTCIGYTDFPSRLAVQSSTLYSNNITKFLLSLTSPGDKSTFLLNLDDAVVRGSIVAKDGNVLWPPPVVEKPASQVKASKPTQAPLESLLTPKEIANAEAEEEMRRLALGLGVASAATLGMGVLTGNPAFGRMLSTLGLSTVAGYYTVWGVVPALHSPLMAVTNAISGLTAVGGIAVMSNSLLPITTVRLVTGSRSRDPPRTTRFVDSILYLSVIPSDCLCSMLGRQKQNQ